MNDSDNTCFSVLVGIDWADTKHDFCRQASGSALREFGTFYHQAGNIDDWVRNLHYRYGGKIAIGLELTKGPLVYALQKYDFLVLFPINPTTLAKYRQAFKPSSAKDDPTDAELALNLFLRHWERFQPLEPQSPTMRAFLTFVERRRELVALGEQRERFASANEMQQYVGVAPVTERSGKKSWVHWRWQCPTFSRQTFVE